MKDIKIECPRCGYRFELSEAMTTQLKSQLESDLQKRLQEESARIAEKARLKAEKEFGLQMEELKETLQEQQEKLEESRKKEKEFLKKKRELEESQKELELTVARKLEEATTEIEQKSYEKFSEEHHQKDMEKDRKIQDLTKALDDARRRVDQGSMERQGEVLEDELEKVLAATFPSDSIEPVPKGTKGADVVHKVFNQFAQPCGTILWEAKAAKNWSEKWVEKLKDDQRDMGAEVAVIVSKNLPKEIDNFGMYRSGLWVTHPRSAIGLATALREQLLNLQFLRESAVGKDQKMEALYHYLAGPEFRQKIEAIVDAYDDLQVQIEKERKAMEGQWAERRKQLERIMKSTVGMYGEMRGIIGKSLPEIKKLQLEAGEADEKMLPEGEEN